MRRRQLTVLFVLAVAACAAACGGGGGQGSSATPTFSATPEQRPDLTLDTIRKAVNGSWVEGVPPADGVGKPEDWGFQSNEPKEIEIVDQKVEGDRATVVVNMKTRSHPRARRQLGLEGQLRLHLELRSEFIFREWDVTEVENISFKFTRLAQPSPSPADSPSPGQSPTATPSPAPPTPSKPLPPQAY